MYFKGEGHRGEHYALNGSLMPLLLFSQVYGRLQKYKAQQPAPLLNNTHDLAQDVSSPSSVFLSSAQSDQTIQWSLEEIQLQDL